MPDEKGRSDKAIEAAADKPEEEGK